MRQLKLKELLVSLGVSQRELAREVELSAAAVNLLCNGKSLPRKAWSQTRNRLAAWLQTRGAETGAIEAALDACEQREDTEAKREDDMILRKQILTARTRQHFKLMRDPFDDPQCPEDVYFSPESRYVREFMYDAAMHGNFMAVVGESGSGKSTLREDLIERLR